VKESKSVQQETLKHFLRSTDMPRSLNAVTASPVIFLTIYRRTANAKNVRTKMKVKCSVCGRIYKAIIPRGGDGSLHWPRKHYRNLGLSKLERLQDDTYCLGSFTEGKLIEEEND